MIETTSTHQFPRLSETPTDTAAPVFAPHSWGLKARNFKAQGAHILGWKGVQGIQKFGGWWLSMGTLYATFGGGCPCCGNAGCPVGGAGAGFLGAILMGLWSRRLKRNHALVE